MHRFPTILISMGVCLMVILGEVSAAQLPISDTVEPTANLIRNASFEDGAYSSTGTPENWTTGWASQSAVFTWDDTQSYDGSKSVKIAANDPDDAYWAQTIAVLPHTNYVLSGYIKTENVDHTVESWDIGANLSILGSWDDHSPPMLGSNDWTYVSFAFNSGERSQVTVAARLGFWAGMTTGTAWFDNIQLTLISPGCDPSYPNGTFRACYYQGRDPYTGALFGIEEESHLGTPVPDRSFGIDHDWDTWTDQDISAIWRGRLYFNAGRYQFTTFARDGVRLFIDEQLLIDEWIPDEFWYRFGTVIELTSGFHDIRVEWFATGFAPESTLLRLHWDRVPNAPLPHLVSPMVIDVFLLKKQDICVVGDPWVSGESVAIYNPDGSVFRAWQQDDPNELPRTMPPSDPSLSNYSQVECFSFGYLPDEIPSLRREVEGFADLIENWSGGDIQPEIRLFEIEGEVNLGRIGTSWWLPPWEIASLAAPLMTTDSDFAIVLSSTKDITTRRSYLPYVCGGTYGVELHNHNFGGTGYSWVTCVDSLIILHEWEHQFSAAVNYLLQFDSIYPVDLASYPPCGMGDPDIFKWFPDSEHWGIDPDSPWCGLGEGDVVGIAELHLFAHYDASLSHYPLGFFTGNHCNNGIQDLGESQVDTGGNCPAEAVEEKIEKQPSDDTWIQVRSAAKHGEDRQLNIQKALKVAFLKFDLQDVNENIIQATLSATTTRAQKGSVEVYAVADTNWQEETLNGKNAPQLGELIDSVVTSGKRSERLSWDVTAFVESAIASGSESVSFALVMADGKKTSFASKESRDEKEVPLLVINSQ
jgi:hypothetical protein